MKNWNFNELTQQDSLDFKACQRQDKSIYGIPDKSDCSKGKELKTADLQKIADKANSGDPKAKAQMDQYKKVQAEQEDKSRAEGKAKKDAKAKKAGEEGGKKGKGGKGKKGGGKGKKGGGKGKASKGSAGGSSKKVATSAQDARKEQQQSMRKRLGDLQNSLRSVKNPEVRRALEGQISDLLKGVSELTKTDPVADTSKTPPKKPAAE